MVFLHEEYESLCAAMALVDAATGQIGDFDDDIYSTLVEIQNKMNDRRLKLLKPFGDRVWHVSKILKASP